MFSTGAQLQPKIDLRGFALWDERQGWGVRAPHGLCLRQRVDGALCHPLRLVV